MVRKHIQRKYSAHRKSVVRPLDEYCMVEIFSYDHKDTMIYTKYNSLYTSTENASETNRQHWKCLESANKETRFAVDVSYVVDENATYRIDALYETKDDRDMTGFLQVFRSNGEKIFDEQLLFDGEKGNFKRNSQYLELQPDTYRVRFRMPVNSWFLGAVIRKIKYFSGDSLDSAGTNMLLQSCTVSQTDEVKPAELSLKVAFDNSFECYDSPSGFYIDYRDEINVYLKDEDDEVRRVFGGYVSSILPDTNYTSLTITAADRLSDGSKRYCLEAMTLKGGTTDSSVEWTDDMHNDFDTYGGALKYLCDIFEETLANNINENYLVAGENYDEGLTGTLGKNGNVGDTPASNMSVTVSDNFITARNNPSAENYQTLYLYDVADYGIDPVDITDFPNFYLTYGLGDPKTEVENTETITSTESTGASSSAGTITVTGKNTCGCCAYPKMAYQNYTRTYVNQCPHCKQTGVLRDNPKGVPDGEITCSNCDADYCVQCGGDKWGGDRCKTWKLTPASGGSTTTTTTTTSKVTNGYDKDNPYKCYIQLEFSTSESNNIEVLILDFTVDSTDTNSYEGITPVLINNVVKQGMIDVVELMRSIVYDEYDQNLRFYIHRIKLITPPKTGDEKTWYTVNENDTDNSSCKLDIYGFGFNNGTLINPKDLSSCGKTIVSVMEDLVTSSGYLVELEYGKHRKDDVINFKVDNQLEPVFVASEGDENNILSFTSISYTPVSNLYNSSIQVFKSGTEESSVYNFTESKDSTSIAKYGQQTTLESSTDIIESKEAYYKCRTNPEFQPEQTYSYSITVPYVQDIVIGDLVQVIADDKKLNTIKKVSSVKFSYATNQIPKIKTELGLGELAPDLLLKKQLRELRDAAKEKSTLFSSTAVPVEDPNVYQWER